MVNWVKSCYQKFVQFLFFFGKVFFFIMSTFLDELNFEKKNPAQRNIEHDLFALKMELI